MTWNRLPRPERTSCSMGFTKKLVHLVLGWLAAMLIPGAASANIFFDEWPQGAPLFSEADLKPCEELWAKHLAFQIEGWNTQIALWGPGGKKAGQLPAGLDAARRNLERARGLSPLEYARKSSWQTAKADLRTVREGIKSTDEHLVALASESGMARLYGVVYSGNDLQSRLTSSLTWRCTQNVRLAQLTNKSGPTLTVTGTPSTSVTQASVQEIKGTAWNIITTDKGCIAYDTRVYFNDQKNITWSGTCAKGQPISGTGTLTLWFSDGERYATTGKYVNGFLNGPFKGTSFGGSFSGTFNMGCRPDAEPDCSATRLSQTGQSASGTSSHVVNKGGPSMMGGKQDPFPKIDGGGSNDPKPAPAPGNGSPGLGKGIMGAPLPKLTAAQISACSEEIRRTQLASQGWSGDVNQVAARLGRFQKDMFEGRCAGHPEAAAYIAGAEKMLSYTQGPSGVGTGGSPAGTVVTSLDGLSGGSSSGGSARPAPPPTAGGDSKQHNPGNNAMNCIAIYHESEMKARGYKTIMSSIMVNNCPYPVSVQWCVEAGHGHRGDCKPGYANLWDLGANATWGIDSQYQAVRYAACRKGPNMGFQRVDLDPRDPYRFACS
jgi:hypothetical protein